jgi:hypothetical protein
MALSYYEKLLSTKTTLYPNGVRLTLQQQYAREADKADARARKKLLEEMQK